MKYFYSIFELISKIIITFVLFYIVSFVNVKFVNNEYIINNIENLFFFSVSVLILYHILFYDFRKRLIKRIPIVFDFFNTIERDGKKIKIYDKVSKYKNGKFIIKNKTGLIDLELYKKNISKLKHYLNVESLTIDIKDNNSIIIDIVDRLPKFIDFKFSFLEKEKIFIGFDRFGKMIKIGLNSCTHLLISGTSGSGKSVFINVFLMSLFFNLKLIKNIYLIDYKGGLTFFKFLKLSNKIKMGQNIEQFYNILVELDKENSRRMEYLKENELEKIETEPIYLIVDEYADFIDRKPNKDEKELLFKYEKCKTIINSLSQISRSQNIKIIIITQRPSSEVIDTKLRSNLQSRIMLKVKDTETIKMILGDSEFLDEFDINPKKFNYGRMIFLNDTKSTGLEIEYLQSPFIKSDEYKSLTIDDNEKGSKKVENILNDTKPIKEEIITPEPFKTSNNGKITHSDNVELRKELFSLTSNINDEQKRKEIRSQLTKINTLIKSNNYDIEQIHKELKEIKSQIPAL